MSLDGSKPKIRLLHHLARTGGTVISKCLGCMTGVMLLSEIHPSGARFGSMGPLRQACDWFALLTPAEVDQGRSTPFADMIALIHRRCAERGQQLVIRDWTHLDFLGVPFVPRPSYQLGLVRALEPTFTILGTATVRHPIDQFLSLRRLKLMQGVLDLGGFLRGYHRFAAVCRAIGFVRYEDFVLDPQGAMRTLCDRLALAYDPGFSARWAGYDKITGEVGAAATSGAIGRRPRESVEPGLIDAFAANADYRRALALLGYRHPA